MNTVAIPPVQQRLAASAGLAGVYISQGIAPEGQPRPYIVWGIVSAVAENNLSQQPEEDNQRVQVDAYSASQNQARQMMQAAVTACEEIGYIVFGPWYAFESDTKLHRWSFDLEVWNARE